MFDAWSVNTTSSWTITTKYNRKPWTRRSRRAFKRGGDYCRLSVDEAVLSSEEKDPDLLTLHDALNNLAAIDIQQNRVVELRVFGGLTVEDTAEAWGILPRTVKREWTMTKAWLHTRMRDQCQSY